MCGGFGCGLQFAALRPGLLRSLVDTVDGLRIGGG